MPAFGGSRELSVAQLRQQLQQATEDWLNRTPSQNTQENYSGDLQEFLEFLSIDPLRLEDFTRVRPGDVQAWRDHLVSLERKPRTVARKLTAIRSLFSYLQVYGYTGANPAHSKFVQGPAVPSEGETPALTREQMRQLLDAPDENTPAGVRDRAIFAVFGYTGIRVAELIKIEVGDYGEDGGHHVLDVTAKGGKRRRLALNPEAFERLNEWIQVAKIAEDKSGALFRATKTSRGKGRDGFAGEAMTRQAVAQLFKRYGRQLGFDERASVHSLRVSAGNVARELGVDILDLQSFFGHADPRTTLGYLRTRDRLSKSPGYVLRY